MDRFFSAFPDKKAGFSHRREKNGTNCRRRGKISREEALKLEALMMGMDHHTRRAALESGAGTVNCAICGKPVERVRPCEYYRRRGEAVCDECCEECYRTEPFPCPDHDQREELRIPIRLTRGAPPSNTGTR